MQVLPLTFKIILRCFSSASRVSLIHLLVQLYNILVLDVFSIVYSKHLINVPNMILNNIITRVDFLIILISHVVFDILLQYTVFQTYFRQIYCFINCCGLHLFVENIFLGKKKHYKFVF